MIPITKLRKLTKRSQAWVESTADRLPATRRLKDGQIVGIDESALALWLTAAAEPDPHERRAS